MANLIRRKQVDQPEFSGFIVEVGDDNYYPLTSNPEGYVDAAALSSATGTLNSIINSTSGNLNTKIDSSGNAAAAFIHEGRGFQQQNLGRADATFGGHALKARFERPDVPAFGDGIDGHENDIVPVQRILRAGIAEACEDLHARLLTLNGPKGQ